MAGFTYKHFTSNSTWTCPAGVTKVYVIAHGGGSGGSGGCDSSSFGYDQSILGTGTSPYLVQLDVVPNTTYTITIGQGGAGGGPRTSLSTPNSSPGGDTSFGSLYSWYGGDTNAGYYSLTTGPVGQIIDIGHTSGKNYYTWNITSGFVTAPTTVGATSGSYRAGQAGAPGYFGSSGGAGGAANGTGVGGNGGNATGFGASGGCGGAGSAGGGNGGNGAPGQMWIIWVE